MVRLDYTLDIFRVTETADIEHLSIHLKNRLVFCKCFRAELYLLLEYVATSLGSWCPAFRDGVVVSSSRLQCPVSPSDVPLHPRRKKPSAAPLWKPNISQGFMSLRLAVLVQYFIKFITHIPAGSVFRMDDICG
jgi:hypothetical protein